MLVPDNHYAEYHTTDVSAHLILDKRVWNNSEGFLEQGANYFIYYSIVKAAIMAEGAIIGIIVVIIVVVTVIAAINSDFLLFRPPARKPNHGIEIVETDWL